MRYFLSSLIFFSCIVSGLFGISFYESYQYEVYANYWKSAELREIMLKQHQSFELDSIAKLETNESNTEMARLCYSLGLYRQSQKYFQKTSDSEIKNIFLGQINMILSEYDMALIYLSKVPNSSFGGLSGFCVKQVSNERPDLTAKMNINDDFSKYFDYFIERGSSVEEFKIDQGSFTIQFGAFSQKERAEALGDKVEKEGLRVVINQKQKDGKTLYLVHGGSFKNREQAQNRADQLSNSFVFNIIEYK